MRRVRTYSMGIAVICAALLAVFFLTEDMDTPLGYITLVDFAPEGFVFEGQQDSSQDAARRALEQGQDDIEEMKRFNLSTVFVEDAVLEANQSYHEDDYTNVFKLVQLIRYIKKEKVEFLDEVELIKRKERDLQKKGIDTSEGRSLIDQTMAAFARDQFDEAQLLLKETDAELEKVRLEELRIEGLVKLSKNFLLRYWWQIILVLLSIGVATPPIVKRMQKKRCEKELARLKVEFHEAEELLKKLQTRCFIEKKMDTRTYKIKAAKCEERIAEIKHTIPVLEAQLSGKDRKKDVQIEKKKTRGVLEVKK